MGTPRTGVNRAASTQTLAKGRALSTCADAYRLNVQEGEGERRNLPGVVELDRAAIGQDALVDGAEAGARKAYRFEARATKVGSPMADSYRLRVLSESSATPVDVASNTTLGSVEFVADSTSVTL